jgi:hypothetical protein
MRWPFTGGARQFVTDVIQAPFGSDDPRAGSPGRIVAHVLVVAALQFGDPIIVLILMKPDDFALGHE